MLIGPDFNPSMNVSLKNQALSGETVSVLQMSELEIAVPIKNSIGTKIGALLAAQYIDDDFAFDLVEEAVD